MKDLTLQKQLQQNKGYVYSSNTLVVTAKHETYTALFPYSGKDIVVRRSNLEKTNLT